MADDQTVHVIDDDSAVRESLAFLLGAADIAVKTYDSAMTFLAALPGVGDGCIVTDVRMPEISGLELLQRLIEKEVQMPVIVITGHGDVPLAVEAMKLGAVDFLEKPFEDDRLIGMIQTALAGSESGSKRQGVGADLAPPAARPTPRATPAMHGPAPGPCTNG